MRFRGAFGILAAGVGLLGLPAGAAAATIEVTTDADEFGQGGSTACTLREAVEAARTNKSFGGCPKGSKTKADRVVLTGDVTLTRTGNTATNADGDLDYDKGGPLVITGGDEAIDAKDINVAGGWSDRILETSHEKVTLRTITMSDGNTVGDADSAGGAIRATTGGRLLLRDITIQDSAAGNRGGAVACEGCTSLTLKRSFVLSGNSAVGAESQGGAIWSNAPLRLLGMPAAVALPGTQAQLVDNSTSGSGDENANRGGAIYAGDDLTVKRTLIDGNSAGDGRGGGIAAAGSGARVTIANSTLRENSVSGIGGGIAVTSDVARATVRRTALLQNEVSALPFAAAGGGLQSAATRTRVVESTVAGNSANGNSNQNVLGGGLLLGGNATVSATSVTGNVVGNGLGNIGAGIMSGERLKLTNSTLSGNVSFAPSSYGGGLRAFGQVRIAFSTIANNAAATGGRAITSGIGGEIRLRASIIDEVGDACGGLQGPMLMSSGYNVDNTGGDPDCGMTAPTDTDVDAQLQSLTENGSPAVGYLDEAIPRTVSAPSNISGGLDLIPPNKCRVDGKALKVDARGAPRPAEDGCDAGAIERTMCRGTIINGPDDRIGRAGRDVIQGDSNANTILAQGGNDQVNIYTGADVLCAGKGNDKMLVGEVSPSLDTIDGGPGRDFISYNNGGGPLTLDLAAGTVVGANSGSDTLFSIEDVLGSQAADTVLGDNGPNRLQGGLGLGGPDTIKGRGGIDVLNAKNGEADVEINCGPGNNAKEKAIVDPEDPQPKSC
jgi:CSLREA domain-containing protein